MPAAIERRLTPEQLRAIVAHEKCHIRRRDNLFAAIHMVVESLFWFHPLVWWIGARLVEERERACDEEVLRQGADPSAYATGILEVCKLYLESPLACVSGVTGADLRRRIAAIMAAPVARRLTLAHKAMLTAAAVGSLLAPVTAGLLHAQAEEFEAASIRAAKLDGGPLRVSLNVTPGGVNFSNATLKACIRRAGGLKPYQIIGGPGWIGTDRFQIVAKTARPTPETRLMPMLQRLLSERFHLETRRETREMPIYSLTVAKGGPKLRSARSDDTEVDGDAGELRMQGVSASMIATVLSQSLDRPVSDRTGLSGKYDVTLKFARETADGVPPDAPSLFTAIQEQIGLKLDAAKGPVEVLIIDAAQKPSEN